MNTVSPKAWKAILIVRKVFLFVAAIAVAALVTFPRVAQADDGHRGPDRWHHGRIERHWDRGRERWERHGWGWHHGFARHYHGCYYWTPFGYRYDWDCGAW